MNSKDVNIPESKLIIMYFFDKVGIGLSELHTIRYLTKNSWANYFDIKEHLDELSKADILDKQETPAGLNYSITEIGKSTIQLFYKDIFKSTRDSIDDFVKSNMDNILLESNLFADYIKLADNEYRVNLKVLDGMRTSFEINMLVFSKTEAEAIMNNWVSGAKNVYKYTYSELMKE